MVWANNISRKNRESAIKKEFKALAAIDSEALDLISYFRIQYVVMFKINTVKLQYREFVMAIYLGQKVRGWSFVREIGRLCPHVRMTTIESMEKEMLIEQCGFKVINKLNHRVHAIRLTSYLYNKIEIAMKEARKEINSGQKGSAKEDKSLENSDLLDEFLS